jgi:CRISPR/Cas system-associated protein Cas7 (RAMP superfamily)
LDGISVPSTQYGKRNEQLERKLESTSEERKKAAFAALLELISGLNFGAKRSRFLPNAEVVSAVATYGRDSVFVVSPGNGKDYLENTRTRAASFRNAYRALFKKEPKISIIAFEGSEKINARQEEKVESVEALVEKLISLAGSD